jgi:diguanylate cyclase (GGDEF)-like protein
VAYWRRSLFAATAARTIAARTSLVQQEECFLAGLLMDLGMLVLDQILGDQYSRICEQAPSHQDLLVHERQVIDLTHADAVGILADQWKLPPLLSQPMRFHHEPEFLKEPTLHNMAYILQTACRCADVFVDEPAAESIAHVRQLCAEFHQIKEEDVDDMLKEIGRQTSEVAPLFEIRIGESGDYETILKKANETLVELTLQTQQQANSLAQQNQKLQIAATRDKLTGLANRALFDERLAEKVQGARQNQRPLSLLMIDIDRFKSINDTFGHQAGDHILAVLGQILASAARASDLAARYGGEELVLLLPETSRATAAAVAESVRRMIAAHAIRHGKRNIKISASIGVATMEPSGPLSLPAHLIKAADLALYAA